eukprot:gene10204-10365_t
MVPNRKQKAASALSGDPKGLTEKLGPGQPLRLVLVGHNPSEYAWHTGHVYANPSNRFWPIMISTGIAPPGTTVPEADDTMPTEAGVGFTDVGTGHPGTDSAQFTSRDFQAWRSSFYARLAAHLQKACAAIGSLPHGWPLPPSCEVWVCTSTSGAAPMSNADRERPYQQLAEQLQQIPWPRTISLKCHN